MDWVAAEQRIDNVLLIIGWTISPMTVEKLKIDSA